STTGSGSTAGTGGSTQVGYMLVGPSSRCFPGLVGLRQMSSQETADMAADVDNDDDDDDGDDDDNSQGRNNRNRQGNQGIGNGAEGADPGNSQPRGGSNDEGGRTPGGRGDR
ncbi:MAG TPA: hypothetical protein DEA79_24655, partial [Cyanobacteria bacterium UBA11153]|nr:hypothetical protein [Cyanobacteria bacterium UBA11153]